MRLACPRLTTFRLRLTICLPSECIWLLHGVVFFFWEVCITSFLDIHSFLFHRQQPQPQGWASQVASDEGGHSVYLLMPGVCITSKLSIADLKVYFCSIHLLPHLFPMCLCLCEWLGAMNVICERRERERERGRPRAEREWLLSKLIVP